MDTQDLGALFVHPATAHDLWIPVVAVVAIGIAISVVGLVRGSLGPVAAFAGLAVVPAVAALLGNIVVLQDSTTVEFCGSCHVPMSPIVASIRADDASLASIHYTRGAVHTGEACYDCHSGYGVWGGLDAKRAGVWHMIHTVTGRYEFPLEMRGPFNIDSCLSCHAETPAFRKSPAHNLENVQAGLLSGEMGCTGMCHPPAHPAEALKGVPQS
jgi:hypothetical protein